MLSTKGIVSLISIRQAAPIVLVAAMSHSFPSWRYQRLSLVGQLAFLDSADIDIAAVEEGHQFSDFAVSFVRVPLHQS